MSERADFKDSIRQLAAQVMPGSEPSAATAPVAPMSDPLSKPALIKLAAEAKSPVSARPSRQKGKRPNSHEWLMKRMKMSNFKQVSVEYPPDLDEMIRRASHGQRMNGKFPGNKREILNVAALEWLERNGWFRPEELVGEGPDDQHEAF